MTQAPAERAVHGERSESLVTILIIEDEPAIRRLLRTTLNAQGYQVGEATTGAEGLAAIASQAPDLVMLDLGLPDIDGLEIIRRLRRDSSVPLIVLTARSDESTKVKALDLGADDIVTKPFGAEELVARVRTALRHRILEQDEPPVFHTGEIAVDLVRRVVTVGGNTVKLSPKEYDLLTQLVIHAGKVLTHNHLFREVWDIPYTGDPQYLRVYIRQLRRKLEVDPDRPRYIVTESGVGYRLEIDP